MHPVPEWVADRVSYSGLSEVRLGIGSAVESYRLSSQLMARLDQIGRAGLELREVEVNGRPLGPVQVHAVNLYLRHGRGLEAFRRTTSDWRTRRAAC